MKIEDKATEYFDNVKLTTFRMSATDFISGAEWLRSEVFLFLAANQKATVKQITEYLKTL